MDKPKNELTQKAINSRAEIFHLTENAMQEIIEHVVCEVRKMSETYGQAESLLRLLQRDVRFYKENNHLAAVFESAIQMFAAEKDRLSVTSSHAEG